MPLTAAEETRNYSIHSGHAMAGWSRISLTDLGMTAQGFGATAVYDNARNHVLRLLRESQQREIRKKQ
jgi:hypothetical protein